MELKGWRELETGVVILEPGNSIAYKSGTWRAFRPIIDMGKCIHCMICWVYCPDSCVMVKDSKLVGIDYEYCKGCGICARECPKKAITMIEEVKARMEEAK